MIHALGQIGEAAAPAVPLLVDAALWGKGLDSTVMQALPNIGPRRAAAIVAARQQRPFSSVADLQRVRGIGPRTVAALASWVRVDGSEAQAERFGSEIGSLP